jgi:hypothetical protein
MLYREIMAVCSEIHTKHINTECGIFNPIPKIAKSGYWLLRVCLSVRVKQLGFHWKHSYVI